MQFLSRFVLRSVLLAALVLSSWINGQAQTPAVTTLARLGGTPDGFHPSSALVSGGDGFYYGVTGAGGPANCGTVYRVAPDGTFATLYAFTGGADGANPRAALVAGGDGFFYGTTTSGANGAGTIFKISPAGAFTSLHGFDAYNAQFRNADGAAPLAALVNGGDGFFYGAASAGGSAGNGTIFRISASGAFNVVYTFSTFSNGVGPKAALTPGGDGFFYGVASSGGTASGVVFRVSPAGAYQVLYNFTGGADGGAPSSALVLSGGVFYGLTTKTFFSVTPAGALTTLHTLSAAAEGSSPVGGLIAGNGVFYGTAGQQGPGGANAGTVFQITPAGALTVLYAFQNRTDGANPVTPPLLGADGNLYGVISNGFNGNFTDGGRVYQLTLAGALNVLHTFSAGGSFCAAALLQAADGDFYGVTAQGGAKNGGTVFAVSANGASMATLHEFDPPTEGSSPRSPLFQTSDGTFYGATSAKGPEDGGTLFHLTTSSITRAAVRHGLPSSGAETNSVGGPKPHFAPALGFVLEHSLSKQVNFGANPFAYFVFNTSPPFVHRTVTRADAISTPTFIGITQIGGDGGAGGIFSYTPGGTPTALHVLGLTADDGRLAEGLAEGEDLNLYGVTYGGGAAGVGTIFKVSVDGSGYSVLYSFKGAGDGAFPQAGLALGSDGALYGTTSATSYNAATGSLSGNGTIFKITTGGAFTTLHTFAASGAEGAQPMAALTARSDGNLYGTTSGGGANFAGTVFAITTGGAFTSLYSFNGQNGGGQIPLAPMILAADGNLYGTTSAGGTDGAGIIFKVALQAGTTPTPTPTPTPPALPTVSVAVTTPDTHVGSSDPGVFTLTLSAAQSTDVLVHYTIKGSAANGTDYAFLKGTAKIKAGKTSKPVKVKPQGDLGGAAKKVVAFTLAPDSAYTIETPDKLKVKIFNP